MNLSKLARDPQLNRRGKYNEVMKYKIMNRYFNILNDS